MREGKCLEITQAYDRVSPRFKHRKLFIVTDEDEDAEPAVAAPANSLSAAQSKYHRNCGGGGEDGMFIKLR